MSIDGYFLLTRKNVHTKKDTIMKHIIVIALLLACTLSLKAQRYDLQRMAISSGFQTAAIGNNVEVIGIAGQAIIDTADARRVAKAGLIYIQETTSAAAQRTILTTPEVVHAVGDTFDLDIDFSASCLLFRIPLDRAWSMKVSFNKTILEPLAYDSIAEDADRYTISVHGNAASDVTLLTRLRFLARLGNDSVTDVRIESFTWIGSEGLLLSLARLHCAVCVTPTGQLVLSQRKRRPQSTLLQIPSRIIKRRFSSTVLFLPSVNS